MEQAKVIRIRYTSNNSGGGWWLSDEHWLALEGKGWAVKWVAKDPFYNEDIRFLNALATDAYRDGLTMKEAIEEWRDVTGQNPDDPGCDCCGRPHDFYEVKEPKS